jgi:hypothetical protein
MAVVVVVLVPAHQVVRTVEQVQQIKALMRRTASRTGQLVVLAQAQHQPLAAEVSLVVAAQESTAASQVHQSATQVVAVAAVQQSKPSTPEQVLQVSVRQAAVMLAHQLPHLRIVAAAVAARKMLVVRAEAAYSF